MLVDMSDLSQDVSDISGLDDPNANQNLGFSYPITQKVKKKIVSPIYLKKINLNFTQ